MHNLKWIFFLKTLCIIHMVSSQVVFENAPYDLGVVTVEGVDYFDIPVKNIGKDKVFIFRTEVDKRFQIHYSSKTIYPDSTIYVRVLFTPDKKGAFDEKIDVHFSSYDKPKTVRLFGFVEEIPSSNSILCPSFSQQGVNRVPETDFTIKVVDEETRELLPNSQIKVIQKGLLSEILDTQKKGYITKKVPLGYYYFIAENENYIPNEIGGYVNRKNNVIVIPLKKREVNAEQDENSTLISEENVKEEEIVFIISNKDKNDEVEIESDIIVEEKQTEEINETNTIDNIIDSNFSILDYKPNNIVFLIDLSSSMNQNGKLDLLKASMIELTKILRPEDKITLVTYASNANILLETTSGNNKDTIISIIGNLKAKGMTDGTKGLEKAYAQADSNFLFDGNNQVFMATDGILDFSDKNLKKAIKKFKKKGIYMSVIGIKNKAIHIPLMTELAQSAKGDFIDIQNYDEAKSNLVKTVKKQAKRLP